MSGEKVAFTEEGLREAAAKLESLAAALETAHQAHHPEIEKSLKEDISSFTMGGKPAPVYSGTSHIVTASKNIDKEVKASIASARNMAKTLRSLASVGADTEKAAALSIDDISIPTLVV